LLAACGQSGESRTAGRATQTEGAVLVIGATRGTGLEVVKILKARGDDVTALVRVSSDVAELEAMDVDRVVGDAFDPKSLDAALAGKTYRAVISTLGTVRGEPRVDFDGNRNAIDAAVKSGVARYLMTSLVGAGDSSALRAPPSPNFSGEVYGAKTQAEDYLKASGLDYTILRPAGLLSEPATGRGLLTEDRSVTGTIHRADLAALIVQCLDDPATIGHIYAAVDRDMMQRVGAP